MELGELKLGRSYIIKNTRNGKTITHYVSQVSKIINDRICKIEAETIITVTGGIGTIRLNSLHYIFLHDPEFAVIEENDKALVEFELWLIETMRLRLGDKKSLEMVKVEDEEVIFIWSWRENRALGYITIQREDGFKIFTGTEELEINQEPVTCTKLDLDLEIGKIIWTLEAGN